MPEDFNENPFLKDTPVAPFSNGSEAFVWSDNNCGGCIKAKECELSNQLDLGCLNGTIPLWVAKEVGCDYTPLYASVKLFNRCLKFKDGTEPF